MVLCQSERLREAPHRGTSLSLCRNLSRMARIVPDGFLPCGEIFVVRPSGLSRVLDNHADAVVYRADETAEVTTDTALFIDFGNSGSFLSENGLVSPIFTSDVADLTADTLVRIDMRYHSVVEVEVAPIGEFLSGQSAEVGDGLETFLVHPAVQTRDHV